jgi:DNA-binding NarL/FixJ family response regulator
MTARPACFDGPRARHLARVGKCFLVVEDEELQAAAFARMLTRRGHTVSLARNAAEARALVGSGLHFDAAFVDLHLPDGCGLDVIASIRSLHERTRVALTTGSLTPDQITSARDLDAEIMMKPCPWARVERFLMGSRPLLERIPARAHEWAERHGLSPTEVEILVSVASGTRRSDLAVERHCSPFTIKTHATHLLTKLGEESLQEAAHRLLLEVAEELCD